MTCIAVDIGGVCALKRDHYEETDEDVRLFDVPDSLKYLHKLKELGYRLAVVSFCGRKRAKRTRLEIIKNHFGLFDGVHFVSKPLRKVDICRKYGYSYLIDDRADILRKLENTNIVPVHFTPNEKGDYEGVWKGVYDYFAHRPDSRPEYIIAPDPSIDTKKIEWMAV